MTRILPKEELEKIFHERHPRYELMNEHEINSGPNIGSKLIVCRDTTDKTCWALIGTTDPYGYIYFPNPLTSVIQKQVTIWQWVIEDEPEKTPDYL